MKSKENNVKVKEKKAGKLRFNVIDAFIIILLVACIAVAVLRFTIVDEVWADSVGEKYYITFKADSLTYSQLQNIVALIDSEASESGNNWVYLSDGTTKIGNLTEILSQKRETLTFEKSDGSIIIADYAVSELDENVTWTIEGVILCNGTYNENNGFLLNNTQYIAANTDIVVKTAFCEFTMTVIDIEKSME